MSRGSETPERATGRSDNLVNRSVYHSHDRLHHTEGVASINAGLSPCAHESRISLDSRSVSRNIRADSARCAPPDEYLEHPRACRQTYARLLTRGCWRVQRPPNRPLQKACARRVVTWDEPGPHIACRGRPERSIHAQRLRRRFTPTQTEHRGSGGRST